MVELRRTKKRVSVREAWLFAFFVALHAAKRSCVGGSQCSSSLFVSWNESGVLLLPPEKSFVAAAEGNYVVMKVGGPDAMYRFSQDAWLFNVSQESWTEITAGGPSLASYNGIAIYEGIAYMTHNDFWQYNIATETWTELSTPAGGLVTGYYDHGGVEAWNGRVYVFSNHLEELWEYTIAGGTWIDLTSPSNWIASASRHAHGVVQWGGRIYVWGGCCFFGTQDMWEYTISAGEGGGTWTNLGQALTAPPSRNWFGMEAHEGRIFVFGGDWRDDMWVFSVSTSTWVEVGQVGSLWPFGNGGLHGCQLVSMSNGLSLVSGRTSQTPEEFWAGMYTAHLPSCTCPRGYVGEAGVACSDIDECSSGACDPSATCINSDGSFTCTCPRGYVGEAGGACSDIDECSSGALRETETYGPASSLYGNTTGWNVLVNEHGDDDYRPIAIPFTFCGFQPGDVFVGSNSYITFGGGSDEYGSLSATNPPVPTLFVGGRDNSYQLVLERSVVEEGVSGHVLRFEGDASPTGGTVGSPDIVWEATFYETGEIRIRVLQNARSSDSSALFALSDGQGNWLQEDTGTADGWLWYYYPGCFDTGCDMNAACNNSDGSFTCQCNSGWESTDGGFSCSAGEDQCISGSNNCHPQYGTCINMLDSTMGNFRCACKAGYSGDGVRCTVVNSSVETFESCEEILNTCAVDVLMGMQANGSLDNLSSEVRPCVEAGSFWQGVGRCLAFSKSSCCVVLEMLFNAILAGGSADTDDLLSCAQCPSSSCNVDACTDTENHTNTETGSHAVAAAMVSRMFTATLEMTLVQFDQSMQITYKGTVAQVASLETESVTLGLAQAATSRRFLETQILVPTLVTMPASREDEIESSLMNGLKDALKTQFNVLSVSAFTDIDECALGTHSCHMLASCTNTIGSFTCTNPSSANTSSTEPSWEMKCTSVMADCWFASGDFETFWVFNNTEWSCERRDSFWQDFGRCLGSRSPDCCAGLDPDLVLGCSECQGIACNPYSACVRDYSGDLASGTVWGCISAAAALVLICSSFYCYRRRAKKKRGFGKVASSDSLPTVQPARQTPHADSEDGPRLNAAPADVQAQTLLPLHRERSSKCVTDLCIEEVDHTEGAPLEPEQAARTEQDALISLDEQAKEPGQLSQVPLICVAKSEQAGPEDRAVAAAAPLAAIQITAVGRQFAQQQTGSNAGSKYEDPRRQDGVAARPRFESSGGDGSQDVAADGTCGNGADHDAAAVSVGPGTAAAPPSTTQQSDIASDPKFAAKRLILGTSTVAAWGLDDALGITDELLGLMMGNGNTPLVNDIKREFLLHGSKDDIENLHYCLTGIACDPNYIPAHVRRQIELGRYHGGVLLPGEFDAGHDGWTLDDFKNHPSSKAARLEAHHVLALRLYTTSSFRCFNNPLRNGVRPHPFAITVRHLASALKKLRAVNAITNPESFTQDKELWRGMQNMDMDWDGFCLTGGTELAPMSTTTDKSVALSYANSTHPMVFRYISDGLSTGVSIQYLSVFPKEEEFLYPPLTFLKALKTADGLPMPPVKEGEVTIYSIVPQIAA